ncbi:MAG: ankyrin repeat domain-containing protein, partial [Pirellulales bacterium]|nr:ankyrin repeat domain-containing protein [Pirellulales bacterium]
MTGEKLKLGTTLLHIAAKEGKMETIELLIASGADVNAKDKNGETPLDYAISTDHTVIADLLRKHDGKTKRELKAAGKPTEPVAEAAQPEPPTAKTPLWKAAMFGEIEPAKQAIADGADVNAKGERGLTPLHFAVVAALDSGDNKVIELLIANGADVNAKDDSGLTPLDSVKRLSEAAAITKKLRAIQGKTDDIPVADLLRKHGGKTGAELKGGETVAEAAQPEPTTNEAQALDFWFVVISGHTGDVKQAIAEGADVNAKVGGGKTPLHGAASNGFKEIAELLIANGADVNAKDDYG